MIELSNQKNQTLQTKNIRAKDSDASTAKANTQVSSWEFFNKIHGIFTDEITKMVNLASTLFTPQLSLPTKANYLKVLEAVAYLKIVFRKFNQITAVIEKNNGKDTKRKKIAKLAIFNALNKERNDKLIVHVKRKDT